MTITIDDGPATVRSVLFPTGDLTVSKSIGDVLTSSVTSIDWATLGASTGAAVRKDFVDALHALLNVSLGDVLAAGWHGHTALRAAAERTGQPPGSAENVELVPHRISHSASPYVEVLLNGVEVGRVTCTLTVNFEIAVLAGRVDHGRLVALHSGDAAVTVAVGLAGTTIATSEPHTIHLPLDLALGDGIQLAHPQPANTGPGRA
jgi:hypothetical protein